MRADVHALEVAVADLLATLQALAVRDQERAPHATTPTAPAVLTAREVDVLEAIGAGLTNRAIGSSLGIAEKTVKTHVANIFTKLQVRSRSQAVLEAAALGLLSRRVQPRPTR